MTDKREADPLTLDGMRGDIARMLRIEPDAVGDDDDLLRIGLDSIGVMRLANGWRRHSADVSFADLIQRRSLGEWWQLLSGERTGADRPPTTTNGGADRPPTDANGGAVVSGQPFPLNTMQHAYWVGRAAEGRLGGVGAHFYTEFDGRGIDPARLERAVLELITRHDMLRARFTDDGRQQILPDGHWQRMVVRDLRAEPPERAERELAAIRDTLSHRRLRVERGEVFDVRLSLLPGGGCRMHVHIEMLVADAESFRILLADLARLYDRPEEPLPPLTYTYQRYIAAVGRGIGARPAVRESAAAYWRARLADLPDGPLLPLAADPDRMAGHRTGRRHRWFDASEWAGLAGRARAEGLTPAMVLLAAFAEVLAAWSEQPRFLLNLPLYNREPVHRDVARLVGDFTSLVLLEADLAGERGFADRVRQLQAQLHADLAHSAYPGVDVLRDLARHRGAAVTAPVVFTSALSLGELFDDDVRRCFGQPGWTMSQTPQVSLDFQVTEHDGGVLLNWDAAEDLFRPGVLDAMFGAYLVALDHLRDGGADWSRPIGGLLPSAQRRVRDAVNATAGPPPTRALHDAFFAHAAQRPERTAVIRADGTHLSYGDLADRALRTAALLRARGVRPGERVVVHLPKGVDQIVAVLGVLGAGATYVPVGVDQPPVRRGRILAAARARVGIGHGAGHGDASGVQFVPPVEADGFAPLPAPVAVHCGQPAYVLHTSGSTGEPKGVVVSHRAAVNTVDAINDRWRVTGNDRVLAVSALEFDLSVYDIFGLLSVGGAVVEVPEDHRRDADRWADDVRRHGVTLWQSVPMLLDMVLTAAGEEGLRPLRLALVGGDRVDPGLAERLARSSPSARLVGLGGVTEAAIHSTAFEVTDMPEHWRSVPYGTPLRNVRCTVVDGRWHDRPDWVPGELWIGGTSLADGYLGDPDRTAERFVRRGDERWYRTGDQARYWPDGTLEFLGRIDDQVKVRGHRIELGEIEAALRADPAVRGAVATVTGAPPRLVAAVTGTDPDVGSLRARLADRLPPYMLPEDVVVLDDLPLSRNGKVDRTAVAAAVRALEADPRPAEPPRGPVETAVAREWAQALGRATVGRDDNFFTLGGDSLVATRLIARLRTIGVRGATLSGLFAAPTLCGFAAGLSLGDAVPAAAALVGDPANGYEPFPPTEVQWAYAVGRGTDFALGGVGSHWYWEFDGADVDVARLEEALNRLIRRHPMLRVVFDAEARQRILPELPWQAITVAEVADESALIELREVASRRIPDPTEAPPLVVWAARYGGGRTRLGFSFDYIALDALSIVTVFSELSTLYRDPDADLPSLGVTFRDYILGAGPSEEELAAARDHWRRRLPDLAPAPALPLRVDPADVVSPRFRRRDARIAPATWQALVARARRHGVTPAAVLAAAYGEVLSAWSEQTDVTVNLTLFDRRDVHPDIDHVLGDFTSLLLATYRPPAGEPFLTGVRAMQQQIWTGMEHRAVSAVWVLRELARSRGEPVVGMPVVFTSALGVAAELVDLVFPFGELVWGLSQTPQVWLDCQVMERAGGLAVNWDAVEDLFPEGVLDAMFDAYVSLVERLATHEWTGALPALLPAPQRAVRERVNGTAGPAPDEPLHAAFFRRAAAAPDRVALAWGEDGSTTYGDLAGRALRVAALVRRHGLRPGEPVAVRLPKGPDQIAAVLGVLAAGGVYVPVGIDQPDLRYHRICADAGARLALVERTPDTADAAVPPGSADAAVPPGSADATAPPCVRPIAMAAAGDEPPLDAPVPVPADALAYVIYTSGSTGNPKGVEIEHRAAVNTVDDINQRLGIGPGDRVLAVSALDFDLSVYDIFGVLGAGGALVLVDESERREAAAWARLVRTHRVTVWNSVPALLDMLLTVATDLDPLRAVLVSGDWVAAELPGRLAVRRPEARFLALGGATEASIWSNVYEADRVPEHVAFLPYGVPLRNQRYRVVDERGRDRPDWVPGELWIGGRGVARGYRADDARTAAQFVTVDGDRWYRTGDRGRYWPDGTLEFLGRRDHQVKVRGHRIELGEVEAALTGRPEVATAVAAVVEDGGVRQIAAAVVGTGPVDVEELRAHAATLLPAYAVPARLVVLDRPVLSANGKIDRRAVAALLQRQAPAATDTGAAPQTPLETLMAQLWAQLLRTDPPARDQNFFALGGDSIVATRLMVEVSRQLSVELSMRELLAAPTVAGMAAAVAGRQADPDMEEGVA